MVFPSRRSEVFCWDWRWRCVKLEVRTCAALDLFMEIENRAESRQGGGACAFDGRSNL
jgi:hypothetical protein